MSKTKKKHQIPDSPILKNRYFLYATSFFSGMSVMAIELSASRLLAPYFSSSQIVWTVIIGTIMIALALGNVIGGRLADRSRDPSGLYKRLFLAACWTALIPFAGKYVIAGISLFLAMFVRVNYLIWASFLSCFLVFVFPLVLLGTVSPSLVKFCVQSLKDNGRTVGELSAINTVGSIIGTFLPTFVTIPSVGTAATFSIFSGILALLSLIYFISTKKWRIRTLVLLIWCIGALFFPINRSFAFWEDNLLYEGESLYNYLQVKDLPDSIIFSTNVMEGVQSKMMKTEGLTGMYFEYALAAPLMAGIPTKDESLSLSPDGESPYHILMLGLGTGTFATLCRTYFPSALVEGVEIDEKIVWLAQEYFHLSPEVQVSVDDGRAYLRDSGLYDVILVDAFQDITIPFQLSSVEFFDLVHSHLKENGIMVVNLNMRSTDESLINAYLCDTIASLFPSVYTMPIPRTTNTVLFASDDPSMVETLAQRSGAFPDSSPLGRLMKDLIAGLAVHTPGSRILTDDKAPVELLGMQAIDEIIGDSLGYYQDILAREGLGGLLKSMGISNL